MASRSFQWIYLIVVVCSSIRGQPVCVEINSILNCQVNTNADFVDLSSVAENIRLSFTQNHRVTFVDSLFPRLPALKTLTVDLRYVQTLSSGRVFQELDALQSLYLENTDPYRPLPQLSITANTLKGLRTLTLLDIKETGIVEIQAESFQDLTNLTQCTISRNQIPSLPDGTFSATQLQTLTLEHLGQFQISSGTLQGLTQLTSLSLTDNLLSPQALDSRLFSGSPDLEELNLENNQLVSLSAETFQGLGKLTRLVLSGNNLTVIEVPVFHPLISLTHLDLTGCHIKEISDGAFSKLGSLTYLKVASNQIRTLTSDTLKGLSQLQFFEAERNQIHSIASNAFSDSPSMIIVHLYNNEISVIHPEAFQGSDTSVLTLHDNQLSTLPPGVFDTLDSLNLLDLSNNPWRCDCNISWLYNWTQTRGAAGLHLDMTNSTICSEPSGRQGVTLESFLAQTYISCQAELNPGPTGGQTPGGEDSDSGTPQSTIIAIIIACILIAIIILVIVAIGVYCRHKKYAFWAPPKTVKPDSKSVARNELKFKARHEIGSFYQDPKTGRVSAMWETDSIQSDYRHGTGMDPEETDSVKNRYVYENAALDVEGTEDPVVVVVDTNGTKVQGMPPAPPPLAPVYLNGHAQAEENGRYSSNESPPEGRNHTTSVPAHGYGDLDSEERNHGYKHPEEHPIQDQAVVTEDDNLDHNANAGQTDEVDQQSDDQALEPPGTPTAHSISSMSDAEQGEEEGEGEASRDFANKAEELPADPAHKDNDENTAEPEDKLESAEVEEGKEREKEGEKEGASEGARGLHLSVSSQVSQDYEHLVDDPGTPVSPHDYETLHPGSLPQVKAPIPSPITPTGSSTEAHGGTAASFVNEAFDATDE